MDLILVTAPTVEPLALDDAKAHLRVEIADDDEYITTLITAARLAAEDYTRRAFVEQTWEVALDGFSNSGEILKLPRPPLLSIVSITYTDTNGNSQSFTDYQVNTSAEPAKIAPAYGYSWPSTRSDLVAARIRYKSGYGVTAENVPSTIIHAIKLIIAELYERREVSVIGLSAEEVPLSAKRLLSPYRVYLF